MALIARSAVVARAAMKTSTVSRVAARKMSSGTKEELTQSKDMWFKTSVASLAFVIVPYTVITLYKESQHEHHEKAKFEHMRIRHKAFPWKASDCDLLDMHCKNGLHH